MTSSTYGDGPPLSTAPVCNLTSCLFLREEPLSLVLFRLFHTLCSRLRFPRLLLEQRYPYRCNMPLRVTASGDPTAPASASYPSTSSSARCSAAPSSASAADCSAASQVRRPAPDVPPESSSSSSGKRARHHGPEPLHDDIDMRSSDERKAEVSPPPSASVVNQSPAAATAAPPLTSLVSSSVTALPQMSDIVPVWASLRKLRAAGLDPRVLTSLVVDLDVDKRACPAPLVLKQVYSSDPESKLAAAAALLGDPKAGFAILPPVLPRALLSADANLRAGWSEAQQTWYQELVSQTRDGGELVREAGGTPEQRGEALTALFKLIDADKLRQLWPQQEFTSNWSDLLVLPSAILHDRVRDVQQMPGSSKSPLVVPGHTYRIRLSCATAEVTYVVACCIANYALLPREAPEAAKRLRTILGGASTGSHESSANADTSAPESDSSDSDGEWHTCLSAREAARQRRRAASRAKQLAAFTVKELSAERFKADSMKPLLQLATRVTMRSWQQHFVECFVSNWQSVGCRDHFDQDDSAFQRVAAAVPELQDATGVRWHLQDQVGGTLVSLFVRDDLCAQLPKLNAILRRMPELQQAALRVVCEAHPRRARGERSAVGLGDRRRYCLTPEDAPSLRRPVLFGTLPSGRPQGTATAAMPSWAAVLSAARPVPQPSTRRPAPPTPIDHRPRKEQRRETPTATVVSAGVEPTPPKTMKPVTPSPSPAPWEARIAALEDRLNGIQTLCDNLRDVPRLLANIQHKLDLQTPAPSPPLIPSLPPHPAPPAPLAPSPVQSSDPAAPAVTAAVEELSKRASAHESLLERLCGQLNLLMQRMSQTETARSPTPWEVTPANVQSPADLPARSHTTRQ